MVNSYAYKYKTKSTKQMFQLFCDYKQCLKDLKNKPTLKLQKKADNILSQIIEEHDYMIIGFIKKFAGVVNDLNNEPSDYSFNDYKSYIYFKIWKNIEDYKFIHKKTKKEFETYEEFLEYCKQEKLRPVLYTSINNWLSMCIKNHITNNYRTSKTFKNKVFNLEKRNKEIKENYEYHDNKYSFEYNNMIEEILKLVSYEFDKDLIKLLEIALSSGDKKEIKEKLKSNNINNKEIRNLFKILEKTIINYLHQSDLLELDSNMILIKDLLNQGKSEEFIKNKLILRGVSKTKLNLLINKTLKMSSILS